MGRQEPSTFGPLIVGVAIVFSAEIEGIRQGFTRRDRVAAAR